MTRAKSIPSKSDGRGVMLGGDPGEVLADGAVTLGLLVKERRLLELVRGILDGEPGEALRLHRVGVLQVTKL